MSLIGAPIHTTKINKQSKFDYLLSDKSQAEEEAETDDEMIEYGRKVANKAVRVAIQTIKSRDWSLRSRMEHYKHSVQRLKEANRRRGRYTLCLTNTDRMIKPSQPWYHSYFQSS